jgi:hypothetical protein
MSFTLEVDFSGLCLYVVDPETQHVGVLMPDCRMRTHHEVMSHKDETPAVPHVGYVRMNLADLGVRLSPPAATRDAPGEPRYELVHRFDQQILQFVGEAEAEPVTRAGMQIPDFQRFAPGLELIPDLFTTEPPAILLMRTILDGGTLTARTLSQSPPTWSFSKLFDPTAAQQYGGQFASFATWTRRFEGDTLTVRITNFAGEAEAEFTLGPVPEGGTLHLDMGNLCAENPLEWSDLETRKVRGNDEDFKWLYRLLRPRTGTYDDLLLKTTFPIPERKGLGGETGDDDCMGGTITASFFPPPPEPAEA